ncbi:MAG TPA: YraN family protein [Lacipirellulaceae bacterium]|nr:YraN family protein [Lacipirellulaceae bacterium]
MSWSSRIRKWLTKRARRKSLGNRGEDAAAKFLKRHGFRILARGVDSRLGELDIVAVDGRTVVFVEVKTRRSSDAGRPAEAIDSRKERRMTQSALAYLKANRLLSYAARFDVIAITWPENARRPTIEHYKNAFSPVGTGQFFG